jgi:hypothetical protein
MFILHRITRLLPTHSPDLHIMSVSTEELFFKSSQFAVVGASKDETKVGNKVS